MANSSPFIKKSANTVFAMPIGPVSFSYIWKNANNKNRTLIAMIWILKNCHGQKRKKKVMPLKIKMPSCKIIKTAILLIIKMPCYWLLKWHDLKKTGMLMINKNATLKNKTVILLIMKMPCSLLNCHPLKNKNDMLLTIKNAVLLIINYHVIDNKMSCS